MSHQRKRTVAALVMVVLAPALFLMAGSLLGAVFAGVGIAIFGWAMTRPAGRRVTVTKCADCNVVVNLEHDAEICTQCDRGLHMRCMDRHTRTVYAAPSAGPFR